MATLSGSYKKTNIPLVATMETLLVAHLTVEDTAVGTAALILGSVTVTMLAAVGAGATAIHKLTQSLNCPDLAAVTAYVASLEVMLNQILGQSTYSNLQTLDIVCNTTMST